MATAAAPRARISGLSFGALLWTIIGVGTVIRLYLALSTDGVAYDLESFGLVADALEQHGFDVYSAVNGGEFPRWPYPPGYFGWILAADGINGATGLGLFALYRLPAIAADAAIAWLVQDFLRGRGASEWSRLAAAGLVALGPSFIAISGHHGQIDSVAILPAVAALVVWERSGPNRALTAGLLIGAGGAVKTAPLLMLVALLASARSIREALTLVAGAAGLVAALTLPFAVADPGGVEIISRYRGGVGLGGIGLLVQPELALGWLGLGSGEPTAVATALREDGGPITAVAVLATGAFLAWCRAPALTAAILVWLSVYAFGVTFFLQYMVWGIPFFLMAGYVREVALLQGLLLPPTLLTYIGPSAEWQAWALYVVPMIGVWLALASAYVLTARRLGRRRELRAATL
jgi:Glycosyltransferase family 87